MQSDEEQELLDAFSEVSAIGQELADKFNEWNDNNFDDAKTGDSVSPDMSGDDVISYYKNKGFEEEDIVNPIRDIGYSINEDSDDAFVPEVEVKKPREISEKLNDFIERCITISAQYKGLVKEVELQEGNPQRKEEVRIVIPAETDIKKMPSTCEKKSVFMQFLHRIRDVAAKFYMTDEVVFFCSRMKEMWLIFRPFGKNQK